MANKIRVYELAKELNKTSKEVMSLLAEKNIEVTTHMATLEDNQADMIRAQAGQAKQETPKTGDTPKASEDAKPKKKKFIVVHNPENSRDRKSPRRPAQPKTQATKSVQKPVQKPAAAPKAEAKSSAKPEVKAEAKTGSSSEGS